MNIIKNATMPFYNENEQICIEKDVLGASLEVSLLQVRDGMCFPMIEAPNSAALQQNIIHK